MMMMMMVKEFAEPEEEVIFDDKNAVVQLTNFSYYYANINTDDATTSFLVDEFKQMFIQLLDSRYDMVTDEFTVFMADEMFIESF